MTRWILLFSFLLGPSCEAAGIGLLTARGSVRVNGFLVWGNATVMDHMQIDTEQVGARVTLDAGPEILIGPAARLFIEVRRVRLERGSLQVLRPGGFVLEGGRPIRTQSGSIAAGPAAARIPDLLRRLSESLPLSQRP